MYSDNNLQYCVVDDDSKFLYIAKARLEQLIPKVKGHFISDPEKVFSMAEENPRTIFLLDINLGAVNGIDIYNRLQNISKNISVIFTTGDTSLIDRGVQAKALSEGGIDFVEKPIKWYEFAIKLKNHIKLLEYRFYLEEKVRERTQMLIHADRLVTVGTMVSSIVHEITSPLTSVKANIENSKNAITKMSFENMDQKCSELISSILLPSLDDSLAGMEHMEKLLRSFREFYRQSDTVECEECSIKDTLFEAKNMVVHRIKKYNIICRHNCNVDSDFMVRARKSELIQLVTNVMNNAVDALEEVDPTNRTLFIKSEQKDKKGIIEIGNNGPAIREHVSKKMFDPFFTTKTKDRGTGLGLAIVREILEKNKASLFLDNKENSDFVTFRFYFPLINNKKDDIS
ncbi:MAG: ATP-binding protein [bacterium]